MAEQRLRMVSTAGESSASRRRRTTVWLIPIVLCWSYHASRQPQPSPGRFVAHAFHMPAIKAPSAYPSLRFNNFALHAPLQIEETLSSNLPALSSAGGTSSFQHASLPLSPPSFLLFNNGTTSIRTNSSDAFESSRYYEDMLGMDELYQNLDRLEHALEQRHAGYQQLVQNLQAESNQAIGSLEHWEQFYASKIEQLEAQSSQAEQRLEARERAFQTQLVHMRDESARKERTALEKIQWLADQLQKTKFEAHRQQLEAEYAARAKQRELQVKLEDLQSKLQCQLQRSDSQIAEHEDLRKERLSLEREVAAVQEQLQQSVRELKALTQQQKRLREDAQMKHRDKLVHQEANLQIELKKLRDDFAAETAALRSQIQNRNAQHDQIVQKMRQDFRTRESQLEEALSKVGSDLQKLKFESHAKLLAEKDAFRQREETLRAKITHQQAEIRKHAEAAAAQSSQASTLFRKRLDLEQEVATLRQKYVTSVSEWEARFRAESDARTRELQEQDVLFKQKMAMADAQLKGAKQEAQSYKVSMEEKLHVQNEEHQSAMEKLRSSFVAKVKELRDRLQGKDDELREKSLAMQKVLLAQKETSKIDQARIYALLRQKEKDLEEQTTLTRSAREKASSLWTKRMELEQELAKLRNSYDETVRSSKRKLDALNDVRKKELSAAFQLLAHREAEAGETIRNATEKAKANELVLEGQLKAKDDQFRKWMQEIREISENEKLELQHSLDSIASELQRYKLELHQKLASEKVLFQSKLQEVKSVVSMADMAFRKQLSYTKSLKEASEATLKQKANLEAQLSALKKQLESSITEQEKQLLSLKNDYAAKEEKMKEVLAENKKQAQAQIDASRREDEIRLAEFKEGSDARETQLRSQMQALIGEARKKEKEMLDSVALMTAQLNSLQIDGQRQLQLAKDESELKRKELLCVISEKEKQYEEQVSRTVAAQSREKAAVERAKELERILLSLKDQTAHDISQWESRYSSLLQSQAKSLQEAETRFAQQEEQSRALIERLTVEAQASKAEHDELLRAKSEDFQAKMREMRSNYENQISETKNQLQAVCEAYQQFKFEAHQSLGAAKEESEKRLRDLRLQINVKEGELSNQVNVTSQLREKVDELVSKAAGLETEIQSLQRRYEAEKAAWTSQLYDLRCGMEQERRNLSDLLERTKSNAERRLEAVLEEKRNQELAFQDRLQAQSDRHSKDIQEVSRCSQAKEAELRQKCHELEQLRDSVESRALDKLKSIEAAATTKLKELEAERNHSLLELSTTNHRLAEERAKSEELSEICNALRRELSSMQSQYHTEVREWKNRCDALQTSLDDEKRRAADQITRRSKEAREKVEKEATLMQKLRDLHREIELKEDRFSSQFKAMEEETLRRETDLQARLAEATDQLEKYKVAAEENQTKFVEVRSKSENDDAQRLAEKVRYDLTKQIVKRNVEILRQKAELKEKEAQIAALKSGLDVDSTVRTRLNLAAVKDRVAKILRGETERAIMPYTFQHSNMLP